VLDKQGAYVRSNQALIGNHFPLDLELLPEYSYGAIMQTKPPYDTIPLSHSADDDLVISVVVPMYNEEANIGAFYERVKLALDDIGASWELVCINDGSSDNTLANLIVLHSADSRVKVINLSRNFGKEVALTAGLNHAAGQAVIPIDADLQDPPEMICELVKKWREGFDVVNATRSSRQGESWFKRTTANLFYRWLDQMTNINIPRNTGDFRLLSRPAINALLQIPERTRFMKGLFAWVGFTQATVYYERHPRFAGKTKWNYWRLWNFALDGITSFSSMPLKIWSYIGLLLALLSLSYASFLIARTAIYGRDVPGYASIMVAVLFLGGIQLITLGVIGEYLGRVYEEVKRRPLYIIRDSYGIEKDL
jgi:polyisoprenyl-phosphate glycosyltransferase